MLHVCNCVCLFVSNAEIVIGFQFGRICSSLQSQVQVSVGGEFIIMPLVCLAASGGGGCPSCRRRCKSFEGLERRQVQTDRLYTGDRPCQADVGRTQENGGVLKTIRARQR